MKRVLFIISLSFLLSPFSELSAQTIFWSEDFGSGCNTGQTVGSYSGPNGTWSVTNTGSNGAIANVWYVSAAENGEPVGNCGVGCGTDPTLHLSSNPGWAGDLGAAYEAGSGFCSSNPSLCPITNKRVESPVIDCSGRSNITLSFDYIENGEGSFDDATLWYYDGSAWSQLDPIAKSPICGSGQGEWTAFSIAMPASADNNPNVRIGFNWTNNDGGGTDPSFAVDSIRMTVPGSNPAPVAAFTASDSVFCQGTCIDLTDQSSNSPTSWNWYFPGSNTPTSTQQNPSGICYDTAGTYDVTLVVSNSGGQDSLTKVGYITVDPAPTADAGPDGTICSGDSITLDGSGGGTYDWTPGNSLNDSTIEDPIASPPDTTTYQLIVTNSSGCSDTDSVVIEVASGLTADAGTDTSVCQGDSVQLNASGGSTYSWSPSAGLSDPSVADPMAFPSSTTTYTVQVGSGSCSDSDQVVVLVEPIPTPSTGNDLTLCSGDSVQLNASGGSSYSWTPASSLNDPTLADPIAFPSDTTIYVVEVTNSEGCTALDTQVVFVVDSLVAVVSNDTTICDGSIASLQATGGANYSWSPASTLSDPNSSSTSASPDSSTQYQVVVSSGSCTPDTAFVNVDVESLPSVDAGPDQTTNPGVSVALNGSASGSMEWSPRDPLSCWDCEDPEATVQQTTNFILRVTGANGCVSSDTVRVLVEESEAAEIYIPNIFSPNGIGNTENETFKVYGETIEDLSMKVYNRWGELVFESNDPNNGWDGTYKGDPLDREVFVYYIEVVHYNGKRESFKGNVTLVR